jgi:hypothetical protein
LAIIVSLCAGERGPRRESLQSPNRDRCARLQASSLTCPLPQTHAFRRAHQAPMPTSGRSLSRLQQTSSSLKRVPSVPVGARPSQLLIGQVASRSSLKTLRAVRSRMPKLTSAVAVHRWASSGVCEKGRHVLSRWPRLDHPTGSELYGSGCAGKSPGTNYDR